MFRFFIILFSLISQSYAMDCAKNPIYCHIKRVNPSINKEKAIDLSNKIYKSAKKYKGDANLAVAIGMQETGLQEKSRKQNIIKFYEECEDNTCSEKWKIVKGITDICMFQFHVDTIVSHNIDPIRLKNDITYCIDWHFKLMNEKKKLCKKMEKPWGCYHSKNKILRNQYIKLVERYF